MSKGSTGVFGGVFRGVFGRAFGGVAVLGACGVLSACSPVQMGAAAIVGNQRITQSALSANVSDLKTAMARVPAMSQALPASDMSRAVLGQLVNFQIMNQAAARAGISVTSSQTQQGVQAVRMSAEQYAQQQPGMTPEGELLSRGIAPGMVKALGRYQAQEFELAKQANHGKLPSTRAEGNAVSAALARDTCQAAKTLNIQINPQYGKMSFSPQQGFGIVPGTDTLSAVAGQKPAAASSAAPSANGPAC